jgi:hypothetical protein
MVNGKCGWLSVYVLALLYLLLLVIAARKGEMREKWEVGPAVVEACELPQLARRVWARCAVAAMVVGSAHAALSGIGRSERERGERDEERVGDVDATVYDKLKRCN